MHKRCRCALCLRQRGGAWAVACARAALGREAAGEGVAAWKHACEAHCAAWARRSADPRSTSLLYLARGMASAAEGAAAPPAGVGRLRVCGLLPPCVLQGMRPSQWRRGGGEQEGKARCRCGETARWLDRPRRAGWWLLTVCVCACAGPRVSGVWGFFCTAPCLTPPPLVTPPATMAVGKNKQISKKGKGKKKAVDPFTKKDWYDIKAPTMFTVRTVGKTPQTRTQGTKIASDGLKGRVFVVSLGDLNNDEDLAFRKMRLRCEDVQGRNVLTNFHGMDMTRDKLCALVRKWQTLIECNVDIKTTDGYSMRMFCIGFTKKRPNQIKRTSYAMGSQQKQIRRKMAEIITREASSCDMKELVAKLIPEVIGKEIEKACAGIYPLQNVFMRKVKVLKSPKFDVVKLMEVYGDLGSEPVGAPIERPAEEETEEEAAAEE